MDNVRKIYEERKSQNVDPFGLYIQRLNQNESVEQITPYDSFLFEDSLKLITLGSQLSAIKENMRSRLTEQGLYEVTIGDINSEYYYLATMLNRLSNETYSNKVWRSVRLLQNIMGSVKHNYTDEMSRQISQHSFNDGMNQVERHKSL